MRRLILTLVLLAAVAVPVSAQVEITPALYVNGAGVALGPIKLPDGLATAPALAFASETNSGLFRAGTNWLKLVANGNSVISFTPSQTAFSATAVTGSGTTSAFNFVQTLNTSGVVDGVVRIAVTDTAHGTGSYLFTIYGGASAATKLFSLDTSGAGTFTGSVTGAGILSTAGSHVGWATRSILRSVADGTFGFANQAETGATTFNIGPATGNTASGTTQITHVNATIDMSTATGTGTGTITVTGFFPAGCALEGFSGRVTTILAGAGLTTWSAGVTGSLTALGTALAKAQDTVIDSTTYTAGTDSVMFGGPAKDLKLTAAAGVFSTGVLKVTATCVKTIAIGS